jgi:serine/threonine-protein kinase
MQEGELSPGDLCDDYRIVDLIAAGGMGDVYEAVHQVTGKTVAVKCLKVRHRNKEDARARMKMEAVVLSELQHANLVQVYDAGVTEAGMVWIAMERLQGQTLRDLLYRSGPLPVPDALFYAGEIADGVDAVHEVNVIHRDLKPENVFVTRRNVVKVLDLGTGKFTGYGLNSTDRMRVIGTTAYMSPEQIKGLKVDPRADVYSLGLILYEMLAGRHALAGADGGTGLPMELERLAIMQLQMTPTPLAQLLPGLPGYVAHVVERAIAKNRDDRFATMSEFSREIRAARKRFVAENRLDDAPAELLAKIVGLREKLGAPPRESGHPGPARAKTPSQSGARPDPWTERPEAHASDAFKTVPHREGSEALRTEIDDPSGEQAFKTELQTRPPGLAAGGETPPPSYERTLEVSHFSLPPGVVESRGADRAMPGDIRIQTTHTNPLGALVLDETPAPLAMPEVGGRRGFWARPTVRRVAVTLGLGAAIGIPPAVLGVLWTVHRARSTEVAAQTAEPAASLPVPAPATAELQGSRQEAPVPSATEAMPVEKELIRGEAAVTALLAARPSPSPAERRSPPLRSKQAASPSPAPVAPPLVAPDWTAMGRTAPAPAGEAASSAVARPLPRTLPPSRPALPGSGL